MALFGFSGMISSTAKSCMIFSTAYFLENHWKQAQNIEPKVAPSKEIMDEMKDKMSIFKLSEVIRRSSEVTLSGLHKV